MKIPEVIAYPYKEVGTDELKYSIRSAVKNLGIKKVIIIGDKPEWLQESEQAVYVPFKPKRDSSWTPVLVAWQYLEAAVKAKVLPEKFLWFNDDFFVLEKLDEWTDFQRDDEDYDEKVRRVSRMYHMFSERAFMVMHIEENKRHFNLHIPMSVEAEKLREAIKFWRDCPIKNFGFRTYYGNKYYPQNLPFMSDCKKNPNRLFLSTNEKYWATYGEQWKKKFPETSFAEKV